MYYVVDGPSWWGAYGGYLIFFGSIAASISSIYFGYYFAPTHTNYLRILGLNNIKLVKTLSIVIAIGCIFLMFVMYTTSIAISFSSNDTIIIYYLWPKNKKKIKLDEIEYFTITEFQDETKNEGTRIKKGINIYTLNHKIHKTPTVEPTRIEDIIATLSKFGVKEKEGKCWRPYEEFIDSYQLKIRKLKKFFKMKQ